MTIIVVAKSSEGLALASDTKVVETDLETHKKTARVARKIVSFRSPHNFVGFTICGDAMGVRPIQRYFKAFERQLPRKRLHLAEYAEELDVFMADKWRKDLKPTPETMSEPGRLSFLVCGFDENADHGRVYEILIPKDPESPNPIEVNSGNESDLYYRGASSFADRLILGCSKGLPRVVSFALDKQLNWGLDNEHESYVINVIKNAAEGFRISVPDAMSLDDAKHIAIMLVRTVIDSENLLSSIPETSCDYPIDVCSISATEGLRRHSRIYGYKELRSRPH
jgi:20S proteasome alpha/beta subunit